jgi:DNA-directed RNA polymerase subunit M/transcription elongation factor TFIIS
MPDTFQFYSQSADATPGKGAGEHLDSPPETYSELKKQKNWRRTLANLDEGYETILLLTKEAELWQAFPKKPRVRRDDLEGKRRELQKSEVQRLVEPAPEMEAEKVKLKKTSKPKEKKTKPSDAVTEAPEGGVIGDSAIAAPAPAPELYLPPPDISPGAEEEVSSIRFCPECRYYLYLQDTLDEEENENYLERLCRNCGYRERDMKGGLISEISIKEKSAESYKILVNEFTREDYRLPRIRGSLKCPNGDCQSNKGTESDILYLKYDPVNIGYIYICSHCNTNWRSRR